MDESHAHTGFVITEELFKSQSRDKQFTLTPFLVPNKPDLQNDIVSEEEIEKIVWGLELHKNLLDDEHYLVNRELGVPVEKYVLPADTLFLKTDNPSEPVRKTLEEIARLQREVAKNHPDEIRLVPKGSAMLGVIWKDVEWEKIKKGEKTGLSIYGRGVRTKTLRKPEE